MKGIFNTKLLSNILLASSLLGLSLSAQAASLDKVKEKGVLDIALYKEFPPYSFVEKGVQLGIDVDIAKELATRLSVAPNIRMVGADENVEDDLRNNVWKGHYLGGGTADVMLHMPVDRQFAEAVDQVAFISPYQVEKLVFAVDTKKLGDSPTVANFVHAKVGVELDTLSDFYLLRVLNGKVSNNVKHYKSISEAMVALKAGEISAVMGPRGEVEGLLGKEKPDHIQLKNIVTPGLARTAWAMGLAVKKKHDKLANALSEIMASMVKDGTLATIFKRYGVTYTAPAKIP